MQKRYDVTDAEGTVVRGVTLAEAGREMLVADNNGYEIRRCDEDEDCWELWVTDCSRSRSGGAKMVPSYETSFAADEGAATVELLERMARRLGNGPTHFLIESDFGG